MLQTFVYFSQYPSDRAWRKLAVCWLWCVSVLLSSMIAGEVQIGWPVITPHRDTLGYTARHHIRYHFFTFHIYVARAITINSSQLLTNWPGYRFPRFLDAVHLALSAHFVYYYLVVNYDNPSALLHMTWSFKVRLCPSSSAAIPSHLSRSAQ